MFFKNYIKVYYIFLLLHSKKKIYYGYNNLLDNKVINFKYNKDFFVLSVNKYFNATNCYTQLIYSFKLYFTVFTYLLKSVLSNDIITNKAILDKFSLVKIEKLSRYKNTININRSRVIINLCYFFFTKAVELFCTPERAGLLNIKGKKFFIKNKKNYNFSIYFFNAFSIAPYCIYISIYSFKNFYSIKFNILKSKVTKSRIIKHMIAKRKISKPKTIKFKAVKPKTRKFKLGRIRVSRLKAARPKIIKSSFLKPYISKTNILKHNIVALKRMNMHFLYSDIIIKKFKDMSNYDIKMFRLFAFNCKKMKTGYYEKAFRSVVLFDIFFKNFFELRFKKNVYLVFKRSNVTCFSRHPYFLHLIKKLRKIRIFYKQPYLMWEIVDILTAVFHSHDVLLFKN